MVRFAASLLVGAALVLASTRPTAAQPARPDLLANMLSTETNEAGFTLGELLDRNILALARHPLSPETLSRVSSDVHRPPRRGIQFELLTPGDIGATIHFRW